jgi:hypothetical protein
VQPGGGGNEDRADGESASLCERAVGVLQTPKGCWLPLFAASLGNRPKEPHYNALTGPLGPRPATSASLPGTQAEPPVASYDGDHARQNKRDAKP